MKVIIAGGRTFNDYVMLKKFCDESLYNYIPFVKEVEIVSGACDSKKGILTFTRPDGTKVYGADGLGERYAAENNYPVKPFPADWNKFGLSAGPRRNYEMAQYADMLIAFWDGVSKGTSNMIDAAADKRLLMRVCTIYKK